MSVSTTTCSYYNFVVAQENGGEYVLTPVDVPLTAFQTGLVSPVAASSTCVTVSDPPSVDVLVSSPYSDFYFISSLFVLFVACVAVVALAVKKIAYD